MQLFYALLNPKHHQPTEEQQSRIRNVVTNGSCDQILDLLSSCAVDSFQDEQGNGAFHIAAAHGNLEAVTCLLSWNFLIEAVNHFGWTPLHQAAWNGHSAIVSVLAEKGANLNAKNFYGSSALTLAARHGYTDTVRLLLELGAESVAAPQCELELNPLMAAALHGHTEVTCMLLERGGSNFINLVSRCLGTSALMLAACEGHVRILPLLIDHGANPDLLDVNGESALDLAHAWKHSEAIAYLEPRTVAKPNSASDIRQSSSDIIDAVECGDERRFHEILAKDSAKADLVRGEDGCTPLMVAAMLGNLEFAKILVSNGAALNRQDKLAGWTALMQATFHGKRTVAHYLVDAGADIFVTAKEGYMAGDLAIIVETADKELLALLNTSNQSVEKFRSATIDSRKSMASKSRSKVWWRRILSRLKKLGHSSSSDQNRSSAVTSKPSHPEALTECQETGPPKLLFADMTRSLLKPRSLFVTCSDLLAAASDSNLIGCSIFPNSACFQSRVDQSIVNACLKLGQTINNMGQFSFMGLPNLTSLLNNCETEFVPNKTAGLFRDSSGIQIHSGSKSFNRNCPIESTARLMSVASANAAKMGPGKVKQHRTGPLRKSSTTNIYAGAPAFRFGSCSSVSAMVAATGNSPSAPVADTPPPVLAEIRRRKSRPPPLVLTGAPPTSLPRNLFNSRVRPHSYHARDNSADLQLGQQQQRQLRSRRNHLLPEHYPQQPQHTTVNRAYYDKSLAHLPVTPTRKTSLASFTFHPAFQTIPRRQQFQKHSVPSLLLCGRSQEGVFAKYPSSPQLVPLPASPVPGDSFGGSGSACVTPRPVSNASGAGSSQKSSQIFEFSSSCDTLKHNDDELELLLRNLCLEKYHTIFEDQELDEETLLTLTDSDLKEIGILNPMDRNQILEAVRQLNEERIARNNTREPPPTEAPQEVLD